VLHNPFAAVGSLCQTSWQFSRALSNLEGLSHQEEEAIGAGADLSAKDRCD
jgi:hypothetical protein